MTLAFRRWRRAPPRDGSSLRTPIGVLCLDRVTVVDEGDITPEDVRRTGMTHEELRASIAGEGTLVRIDSAWPARIRASLSGNAYRIAPSSTRWPRSWPGSTPRARGPGPYAICS